LWHVLTAIPGDDPLIINCSCDVKNIYNMKQKKLQAISCFLGLVVATSCQNGSIEHIAATKLVIVKEIPVVENKFDEDFKAVLDLLYPHECHDTVFIQDQVFIERIDLKIPVKHEFVISPSLLRDFFGSNNPDKKAALREDLMYNSDSAFEKRPDSRFLSVSQAGREEQAKAIGDYLSRNRKNALVYFVGSDSLCKTFPTGSTLREVYFDYARLNCRIVEDLKRKNREELAATTVVLVLVPSQIDDSTAERQFEDNASPASTPQQKPVFKSLKETPENSKTRVQQTKSPGMSAKCPPDSTVERLNRQYVAIITEFRNLLHYIATTSNDAELLRKYRDDAFAEIHRIPQVVIEGIKDKDLGRFLNSGFRKDVSVTALTNRCKLIVGVRIVPVH
jgi:hypothetical protein